MTVNVDVVVAGAGPAGATAALNLAPTHRVLLTDCRPLDEHSGIGECLAPAARRLLSDMGLWDQFRAQQHLPCYGNRSVWGSDGMEETDFLRDPDGHGWHLDRGRFDAWLRVVAEQRGAVLMTNANLQHVERVGDRWKLTIGGVAVEAAFLIDATGRFSPLGRRLGAQRVEKEDRLVCTWVTGTAKHGPEASRDAGFTFLEAVEDGWWYTAPLPGSPPQRLLAFHTQADSPLPRTAEALLQRTSGAKELCRVLARCGFAAEGAVRMMVASGSALSPSAGDGWLAAGDAAVCFDPLSSQGLLNALFTGLAGAMAAAEFLAGDEAAIVRYGETIAGIEAAYEHHRMLFYRTEQRWPRAPFWERRANSVRLPSMPPPSIG